MGYDVAVFRPSEGNWYFRYPFRFRGHQIVTWGEPGDIPVSADYDFDGKGDIGVYRPSTGQWFLIKSRHGDIQVTSWGEPGDIPVPDDYLHDGRADLAVYRPSNNRWYFVSFDAQSQMSWSEGFGEPGDIPTNAAYRY